MVGICHTELGYLSSLLCHHYPAVTLDMSYLLSGLSFFHFLKGRCWPDDFQGVFSSIAGLCVVGRDLLVPGGGQGQGQGQLSGIMDL